MYCGHCKIWILCLLLFILFKYNFINILIYKISYFFNSKKTSQGPPIGKVISTSDLKVLN